MDVNLNIFLTQDHASEPFSLLHRWCVAPVLRNIRSPSKTKSPITMLTLRGYFSQIHIHVGLWQFPSYRGIVELLFGPLDLPEICGQLTRRSSVQLTLGFAQGPASGDVQHAIDGHGPAAQALHGGQQTFHLQLQYVAMGDVPSKRSYTVGLQNFDLNRDLKNGSYLLVTSHNQIDRG